MSPRGVAIAIPNQAFSTSLPPSPENSPEIYEECQMMQQNVPSDTCPSSHVR